MNERDVVDWILAVSGISTSFILAIAAGLAFVVQRARYRREIEPDVRFTGCWINSPPGVSDGEVGFTIHAQVQNSSGSRAHLLRLRGYINLTPTQTDPSIMLGKRASREWHHASRVKELAAGEQEPMAIELVSSVHANPSPLEVVRSLAGVVHFGAHANRIGTP